MVNFESIANKLPLNIAAIRSSEKEKNEHKEDSVKIMLCVLIWWIETLNTWHLLWLFKEKKDQITCLWGK